MYVKKCERIDSPVDEDFCRKISDQDGYLVYILRYWGG